MWIEMAQSFTPNCLFHPPAQEAQIAEAEVTLGVSLPEDLRSLLCETDGLDVRPSFIEWGDPAACVGFLYPVAKLIRENQRLRPLLSWMKGPHAVLFFGSTPNGDYFGFPILADGVADTEVVRVSHEDASVLVAARSLRELFVDFLGFIQDREREAAGR